jgi:GNAT superfamily N-acetyltransferase
MERHGGTRVVVTRVSAADWPVLRDVRLQALADSPDAFLGTLAAEQGRSPDEWRRTCDAAQWFVATRESSVAGLGCVAEYPQESPRLHLEGMWVDPAHRGSGVGIALLHHAEGYARRAGEASVGLWVVVGNDSARRFYVSHGYTATGREGPLPGGRVEREFARRIDTPEA